MRDRRPDVEAAIIRLHRLGFDQRTLRTRFHISPLTVRAVLLQSKVVTDNARDDLAIDYRHTARRLIERVHEVLDDDDLRAKVSAKDASFASASLSERADQMQGHATLTVDVSVEDPGRDEFASLLMGLGGARARTMQRAEVHEQDGAEPAGQAAQAGADRPPDGPQRPLALPPAREEKTDV